MKFLEEQREKGGTDADDLSNPRWRAAVDAWIPTWQRWEEAEARRIERRDLRARNSRKRKDRSFDLWDGNSDGWRPSATPVVENRFQAPDQSQGPGQSQQAQLPSVPPASPPVPAASTGVGAGATPSRTPSACLQGLTRCSQARPPSQSGRPPRRQDGRTHKHQRLLKPHLPWKAA